MNRINNLLAKIWLPSLVFIISFIYYIILCAKEYTWLFASGDSGDWLAASTLWIVPQPYGSPLYIVLGHLVNSISSSGMLPVNMTILLSCLPASITVMLVFLIVKQLTGKVNLALISSSVLLASGIFLTQATILEEYAIAVMFVVLAYYWYIQGRMKLTALALGLGSAIHILVILISLLWLVFHFRDKIVWTRMLPIYIVTGILPYLFILYLMTIDTPPLLAGNGLSLEAINSYLGSTSVFGSLSILGLPQRLLEFGSLIILSLGLALIPIWFGLKRGAGWNKQEKIMIVTIGFPVWYYLTCIDPTSWTFMTYSMPFLAIACGIGLQRLKVNTRMYFMSLAFTMLSVLVLLGLNAIFLNANKLSQDEPLAMNYYNEIMSIEDGSVVVIHRGGFEAMAFFYAYSQGKDLIPVYFTDWNYKEDVLYLNYVDWIHNEYGLEGDNTQLMVQNALNNGENVYVLIPMLSKWRPAFNTEDIELEYFDKVIGVDLDYEVHTEENKNSTFE